MSKPKISHTTVIKPDEIIESAWPTEEEAKKQRSKLAKERPDLQIAIVEDENKLLKEPWLIVCRVRR